MSHTMYRNHSFNKNDENREIIEAISYYVSYCKVRCCETSCAGMGREMEITGNKCRALVHLSWTSMMTTWANVMCVQCLGGWATEQSLKALNELECSWVGIFWTLLCKSKWHCGFWKIMALKSLISACDILTVSGQKKAGCPLLLLII